MSNATSTMAPPKISLRYEGACHTAGVLLIFDIYNATGVIAQKFTRFVYMQTVWAMLARDSTGGTERPALGTHGNAEVIGGNGGSGETTLLAASLL